MRRTGENCCSRAHRFLQLQDNMLLLVSHIALLTYAEAYSIVADLLARMEASESLTEDQCVARALKLGHQALPAATHQQPCVYWKTAVQKNGFKMAEHRNHSRGRQHCRRRAQGTGPGNTRDVLRRLELIRAFAAATRGNTLEK